MIDLDRVMTRFNSAIAWLLRSRFHSLASDGLMLLTVTGRKTGRRYTIPVGYQQHGDHLVVLVSKARRKKWWRNYLEPRPVEMLLRGRQKRGTARVVAAGSDPFYAALEQTFGRMPWLSRQFGVRSGQAGALSGEDKRTLAREAAVVRIDLARRRTKEGSPAPSQVRASMPSQ